MINKMKKILSIVVLTVLLGMAVAPVALAIEGAPEGCVMRNVTRVEDAMDFTGCDACTDFDAHSECGMCCLLDTIYEITDWIFYLLMISAVLVIIYGGFLYITAAGDPEKASKGKTALTLAIIGIVIALIARLVPSAVRFIMGM